jgi:hypothetical protein
MAPAVSGRVQGNAGPHSAHGYRLLSLGVTLRAPVSLASEEIPS